MLSHGSVDNIRSTIGNDFAVPFQKKLSVFPDAERLAEGRAFVRNHANLLPQSGAFLPVAAQDFLSAVPFQGRHVLEKTAYDSCRKAAPVDRSGRRPGSLPKSRGIFKASTSLFRPGKVHVHADACAAIPDPVRITRGLRENAADLPSVPKQVIRPLEREGDAEHILHSPPDCQSCREIHQLQPTWKKPGPEEYGQEDSASWNGYPGSVPSSPSAGLFFREDGDSFLSRSAAEALRCFLGGGNTVKNMDFPAPGTAFRNKGAYEGRRQVVFRKVPEDIALLGHGENGEPFLGECLDILPYTLSRQGHHAGNFPSGQDLSPVPEKETADPDGCLVRLHDLLPFRVSAILQDDIMKNRMAQ